MKHYLRFCLVAAFAILLTYIAIRYDQALFYLIYSLQSPALTAAMIALTNIATLYIGVPAILAALHFTKHKKAFWDVLVAVFIGVAITFLLKMAIARARPDEILVAGFWVSAMLSSFPSDHASTAFIIFGVLAHHFGRYKSWLYVLAALIGLSRIYLGVHYPTDVLAGAFIGILVSELTLRYKLGDRIRRVFAR